MYKVIQDRNQAMISFSKPIEQALKYQLKSILTLTKSTYDKPSNPDVFL